MGPCDYISTAFTSFSARPLENTRSHARAGITLPRGTGEMPKRERDDEQFSVETIFPGKSTAETARDSLRYNDRWPHDGPCSPDEVALLLIDFQKDFCHPDGYLAKVGGDLKPAQTAVNKVMPVSSLNGVRGVRLVRGKSKTVFFIKVKRLDQHLSCIEA